MDELIKSLSGFGPWAIIAAVFVYQNWYYQKKIVNIVENNTKALTELKDIIDRWINHKGG